MTARRLAGVATLVAAFACAIPASAQDQTDAFHDDAVAEAVEQRPALANFEGRTINLAQGWDGARACVVYRERGILDCYRTREEGQARVAAIDASLGTAGQVRNSADRLSGKARRGGGDAATVTALSGSCGGPLELYDAQWWGGGASIWFYDRGYWQNLWDYGFDNITSSFFVGPCYVHLAENAWGGGYWYPGDTSPYAAAATMGSWNNRVSSIFIE